MTGERVSTVTYSSNIASSGIQVLQICSRAQFYLFTELLRLGIHIPCRGGARFSGLEGPKFFLLPLPPLRLYPRRSPRIYTNNVDHSGLGWVRTPGPLVNAAPDSVVDIIVFT
jgi:hypothetical protein